MGKTIHFSIDDVINSFYWLKKNRPKNIYDMRLFGTLKEWNSIYNMKCTLYIFERINNFSIEDIPVEYLNEIR